MAIGYAEVKYLSRIYINVYNSTGTLGQEIKAQPFKNVYPKGIKKTRTALDSLLSADRKQRERNEMSSDLYSETDEESAARCVTEISDGEATDSSGNGTRFAERTGIFSLDFPPSPKVPKGRGKKSLIVSRHPPTESDSNVTTVLPTQTQELTVTGAQGLTSDYDIAIQPSGFITKRRKRKRSLSRKKSKGDESNAGVNVTKKLKG